MLFPGMQINLVILQPTGYIHSLCFLDTARYLRHHLRAHGIEAHIAKNRPLEGMPNIIFGAHLGMPAEWLERYCCILFNQEQIGQGGAELPADYLNLLRRAHTIDYDPANLAGYALVDRMAGAGPQRLRAVIPLRHAPHLQALGTTALVDRPIDLLFFGSMNESRAAMIQRIEACGLSVARFDHPMYGPERDAFIAQSRAVLNLPFYDSNRFEQVRVFNALSIGTPVVSLRRPGLQVEAAYEHSVHWFAEHELEHHFGRLFGQADWLAQSERMLAHWRQQPPGEAFAELAHELRRMATPAPAVPATRLNFSPERGYWPGWCHVGEQPETPGADLYWDWMGTHGPQHRAMPPGTIQMAYACESTAGSARVARLLDLAADLLAADGRLVLDINLGAWPAGTAASLDHASEAAHPLRALREQQVALLRAELDRQLRSGAGSRAVRLLELQGLHDASADESLEVHRLRIQLQATERSPREQVINRRDRLDFGDLSDPMQNPSATAAAHTAHTEAEPDCAATSL